MVTISTTISNIYWVLVYINIFTPLQAPPPAPNLIYADLDHVSASGRVNTSSIPATNYSDLAQLPDHTTYAAVNWLVD